MDRGCFLRSSAKELDGLLELLAERERRRMIPAALICSVIANVNRNPDDRPNPWRVEDFLPGAKSDDEEMIEWLEAIERGEDTDDPGAIEQFKAKMKATFRLN